jgi:hypothetical protein
MGLIHVVHRGAAAGAARPAALAVTAAGGSLCTHVDKPGGGPGEGFGQLRFLNRQLVLPVSMMSQWWVKRSSMAVVTLACDPLPSRARAG